MIIAEHFEVYPTSGSCAFDSGTFGELGRDEAMDRAREASAHKGPDHCVDRITTVDGRRRRNLIAEFRNGQLVTGGT
jgi:hypothetical protein